MAKNEPTKPMDEESEGDEQQAAAPAPRFSRRFLMLAAGGGLALLLVAGGAAFFFLAGGGDDEPAAEATAPLPAPPQVAFFDMPDMIVNIQSPDGTPTYLKLSVALELDRPETKAILEPLMPRIVDQFQTYLRELRLEDIRGSAGVMRLKEELLRRITIAAAPAAVRDVLLKEMIVQ